MTHSDAIVAKMPINKINKLVIIAALVLAAVFVGIAAGVLVVWQLAEPPAEAVVEEAAAPPPAATPAPATPPVDDEERDRWPLIGILIPAAIFLFATWITSGLYHHFTTHGHGGPEAPAE